jgi:transposase InsO family protein
MVRRVLEHGWAPADAAQAAGVSVRTLWRWIRRYRQEGAGGLVDRRSRPHRLARCTSETRVRQIERLRRQRLSAAGIARRLHMPRSTVAAVLRRLGLGRLRYLDPKTPVRRYQRQHPGELVHLDTKKLGRFSAAGHRVHGQRHRRSRGAGWEFLHVCVDDASRAAYVEALADERGLTAAGFLRRVVAQFHRRGVVVQAVLTDNGTGYRSVEFARACRELGLRHLRTRPYRPRTNGKAERFIQTLLREWAYARTYRTSNQRARALPRWLRYYNTDRPHSALGQLPPFSQLQRAS